MYISKHNNQVNLLMITTNKDDLGYIVVKNNGEWYDISVNITNWHYLAVKKISALLRGITSNHNGNFYCLNCIHSYTTKEKLKKHERMCKDHDFCSIKMPDEDRKILKNNPGEKSLKVPWIIFVDLECLLEKIDTCQNNPEKSYEENKAKHTASGYSLVTCRSFDKSKNERKYYRGEDCMEMLSKDLREQAMKISSCKKKEMIPLTHEEKESYEDQKICYICKKEFSTYKKYCKFRHHCHHTGKYREAAHSICNLRYKIPRKIPVVFHNGSAYDYHFIIEQLAKEFKDRFDCLGENTEKHITFSVPINIEYDNGKTVIYKLKFIDSYRFMDSSLSSLVDNLSEINNKKPEDEFIDNFRSMLTSLSHSVDNLSEINKKVEKS